MGPFNPSEYYWLILMGVVIGLYGTLIGAGGGFVLMPILLLLHPKATPEQLTAISLAVVFFNALAGSESYAMMKRIDYKSGLMFAAATIPGAIIGALNTSLVPRHLFNGIFAVLLIAGAIFLTWRPQVTPRSELHVHRPYAWRVVITADGERHYYNFNPLLGIVISFVVGYLSSFSGDRRWHHSCAGPGLLAGFSGAHRHGHLSFCFGHYGLDRHPGSHFDWFFTRGSKTYPVPVHWCIAGGAGGGLPLHPAPG